MVLFGGHAWFYLGGVGRGGMCGFIQGACMVLFGGCVWFYLGGMHGFIWGACMVLFSFFGYNEIQSMSGQYASYWNAFLYYLFNDKSETKGQGSHSTWKTSKTWKNESTPGKPGNIMEY